MSAHTPGPWAVGKNERSDERIEVRAEPLGLLVALVEKSSDARLIAAAPDLLEALRVLVEVASVCIPETAGHELEQARAAIAKAEGK